jgi:hypothetical protein
MQCTRRRERADASGLNAHIRREICPEDRISATPVHALDKLAVGHGSIKRQQYTRLMNRRFIRPAQTGIERQKSRY